MGFIETYGLNTIILMGAGWTATLVLVFMTGIGKRVIKRLKQQLLYKKGGYVNTIMLHNNGVANEHFIKKTEDNAFRFGQGRYVVVRNHSILLDGIPTQFNIEGISEPLHLNSKDAATEEKMSTAEINQLILNNATQDFLAILNNMKPYLIIIAVVMVVAVAAGLYFNWQIYDALVQQGVNVAIGEINER